MVDVEARKSNTSLVKEYRVTQLRLWRQSLHIKVLLFSAGSVSKTGSQPIWEKTRQTDCGLLEYFKYPLKLHSTVN